MPPPRLGLSGRNASLKVSAKDSAAQKRSIAVVVNLKTGRDMQNRREFLRAAGLAAGAGLVSGRVAWPRASGQGSGNVGGAASLRAHGKAHGLFVGCAVSASPLADNPAYAALIAEQCSIVVAENAMKWGPLSPAPGKYDFHEADALMDFAAKNGQQVRGHNLIWHEQLPTWFPGPITKANARQAMIDHIQAEMQHFAGRIQAWDVVNEGINPKDGLPNGLRKTPWLELVGPDYIDLAYRTAREADPKALLTYNDYDIEYPDQEKKRDAVLAMVRRMKATGVPIDAVGVQSHLKADLAPPGKELQEFVREMAKMNLQVFVTELDVADRKVPGTARERDAVVAKVYRDYLTMMLAEPNVKAVLTWGITDRYTWLNGEKEDKRADGKQLRPLPFDENLQPTAAFYAERDAIDSRAANLA
jgi:endo-1,4-beta-xylanase